MLLRFPEQNIHNFIIPAFQINEGEIAVIDLWGGALFSPFLSEIKDLLRSQTPKSNVEIDPRFRFVEHFLDGLFRFYFFPATISRYHQKYANKDNPIYKEIYQIPWLTKKIKVHTLAGTAKRKLEVYTALSSTNLLIFDLVGVDPKGGKEIFEIVKQAIVPNGAAIILDHCDEFKEQCNTFIKVNYIGNNIKLDSDKLISKHTHAKK
jgi:hypothetical protein